MSLLIGTPEGVHRVTDPTAPEGSTRRVLDAAFVNRIERFDAVEGVFVAAERL
jgi:hypothetical protein